MSYIGRQPQIGNFQICDAISTVNNQAAYTMQVGSVNVLPETANHMIVSLNGVIQAPISSFTVSGSTITFAANLVTGDVINFIQILGDVLDLGVPSDGTVTNGKIANDAVTLAKMAPGTDGNIISYDTSGNPVAVATGNDGQVLTSAGAGAIPTFETLPVGGITMADQWRQLGGAVSAGDAFITSNWERTDTDSYGTIGSAMSESSGVFTFPSTGIYYLQYVLQGKNTNTGNASYMDSKLHVTTNNSSYNIAAAGMGSGANAGTAFDFNAVATFIFDVTNTSTHKIKMGYDFQRTGSIYGSSGATYTSITVIRLGDT